MSLLTEDQWAEYEENGFLRLGRVVSDESLHRLQSRIDAIMLGTAAVDYEQRISNRIW